MQLKKIFGSILVSWLALISLKSNGQSLRGKVIYVSSSQEVILKFRSGISNYNFSPKESVSLFGKRLTNHRNLSLSSTKEDFPTTTLSIIEGNNTHLFLLEYKEKLDPRTETIYDFSSKEKLRSEADKLEMATNDVVGKPPVVIVDTEAKVPTSTQEQKPNPKEVENIENRQNANKIQEQVGSSDQSYKRHLKTGDSALNAKAYEVAKFEYNEALGEKPNDPQAKTQIVKIDQLLKDDAYSSYMSIGNDALANQLLDSASIAFNEALKIRPNDSDAKKGIMKVTSSKAALPAQKKEEQIRMGKDKQFSDTVNQADKMFAAGQYSNAKEQKKAEAAEKAYEEGRDRQYNLAIKQGNAAMNKNEYEVAKGCYLQAAQLKPTEKLPALKLQVIDTKLVENMKNEKYEAFVHYGDSAYISKDYKASLRWYDSARLLKADATYPRKQIMAVNQELLFLDESTKKQKRNQEFEVAKVDGDRADTFMRKQKFEDAYVSYNIFLQKVDTFHVGEYQRYQQFYINQAKDNLARLERYKPKPKIDTVVAPIEDDKNNNKKKKKKNKNKDTGAIFRNSESSSSTVLINKSIYIGPGRRRRQRPFYERNVFRQQLPFLNTASFVVHFENM